MCVRCAAAARNISGEAIISQPDEWCSPHQNSSKTEPVEVGGEVEVALEQQRRVLAGRVVRGEEGTELDPWHREILRIGRALGRIGRWQSNVVRDDPTDIV